MVETSDNYVNFRANNSNNNKTSILKVLIKSKHNEKSINNFIEAINIIKTSISHPNLIKYENVVINDNYILISRPELNNKLELLPSKELVLFFDVNSIDKIMLKICEIIKIFHENGIYHGGIKLYNIFLNDEENDYMLCDYCLKILNNNNIVFSKKTVNLLSPEELENKELELGIDIWCIGVLFYKILSGEYPFESDTINSTIQKILRIEYPQLVVQYKELLNPLISKLLLKDSKNRISIDNLEKEIKLLIAKQHPTNDLNDCKFVDNFKHESIEITNNYRRIRNTAFDGYYHHCFLNIKMTEGIHHFIYEIHDGDNIFDFGASKSNIYEGNELCSNENSCDVCLYSYCRELCGENGEKRREGFVEDIMAKDGGRYEIIFNINEKTMSIKEEGGKEILLFNNIETPLYPYVTMLYENNSVDLIQYFKD